jgi:succinyl-CoA synthetase alpha subunit
MNFSSTIKVSTTKVILQGITEPLGATYAAFMKAYGTRVLAGISPGHGGQVMADVPVFDLVEQALARVGKVHASVIFSHPHAVLDAAVEAIAAGIRQIVIVSQGVPPLDMVHLIRQAEATDTFIVGPSAGLIVPDQLLLGVHPPDCYTPGPVGIISRSGSLSSEVAWELTRAGWGQSIGVCIGSDEISGSTFPQWLQLLEEDDNTEVIVLVGEIGGDGEEAAAHYIAEAIDKPVVAYIAGRTAPRDRRMGHAGAIVDAQGAYFSPNIGTAESKVAAFRNAKIPVADRPSDIPRLVQQLLDPVLQRQAS